MKTLISVVAAVALFSSVMLTPVRSSAQGLVEYALILVVVSISLDEALEISVARSGRGKSTSPGKEVAWTYMFTNVGDSTCSDAVQVREVIPDGFVQTFPPILLDDSEDGPEFVASDGSRMPLDKCFKGADRVSIAFGPMIRGPNRGSSQRKKYDDDTDTVANVFGGGVANEFGGALVVATVVGREDRETRAVVDANAPYRVHFDVSPLPSGIN